MISENERALLATLAADVGLAWAHGSIEIKKRILRTVLHEVIIRLEEDGSHPVAKITFHWAGGVHTSLRVRKNRTGQHGRTTSQGSVSVIRMLAATNDDGQIAGVLNRGGHRTGAGFDWTRIARRPCPSQREDPASRAGSTRGTWLTRQQAARALEIAPATIDKLLKCGALQAHQPIKHASWFIAPAALKTDEVKAAVARIRAGKPLSDQSDRTMNLPFNEHGN